MTAATVPTVPDPAAMRTAPRPKYLALALTAAQQTLAYRGATILNIAAGLAQVAVPYYLWRTVLAAEPGVGGFDWERMRTYVLLAYGVNALLAFPAEARLFGAIRSGQVAVELLRPTDYLKAQLAQAVGSAAVEGGFGAALTLALGLAVFRFAPPASPAAALLFPVSVALGFLTKFLISYLTGLLCFWTLNATGLLWARAAVTNILSGALIPLALFPDWLRAMALAAPFQAIVHTPLAIYLGEARGLAVAGALAVQGGWIVALWVLARILWIPAVRTLTVQGG